MGNTPKITRITIDNVKYDIDLPSDASPVIDSLEVTRQLIVPVIDDSKADNLASMAANGEITRDDFIQQFHNSTKW